MRNKIEVMGPCWGKVTGDFEVEHDCRCNELDNADPEEVGYPPFHEGCTCIVTNPRGEKIMCKETDVELEKGNEVMKSVVEHLIAMGNAARCKSTVEVGGVKYSVSISADKIGNDT